MLCLHNMLCWHKCTYDSCGETRYFGQPPVLEHSRYQRAMPALPNSPAIAQVALISECSATLIALVKKCIAPLTPPALSQTAVCLSPPINISVQ